jgi:hypothetical protein
VLFICSLAGKILNFVFKVFPAKQSKDAFLCLGSIDDDGMKIPLSQDHGSIRSGYFILFNLFNLYLNINFKTCLSVVVWMEKREGKELFCLLFLLIFYFFKFLVCLEFNSVYPQNGFWEKLACHERGRISFDEVCCVLWRKMISFSVLNIFPQKQTQRWSEGKGAAIWPLLIKLHQIWFV